MSSFERPRRDSPRPRRPVLRAALVLLGAVLAFLLGIAFARTLDDRPQSGGDQTIVRTLTPGTQSTPGRTVTVTVTTSGP